MSDVARAFRVAGRVQGVYFRHSTRLEAERLGLRGTARNCEDGTVEVIAVGEPSAVAALLDYLRQGPVQARVDSVEELPLEATQRAHLPDGFEVR